MFEHVYTMYAMDLRNSLRKDDFIDRNSKLTRPIYYNYLLLDDAKLKGVCDINSFYFDYPSVDDQLGILNQIFKNRIATPGPG